MAKHNRWMILNISVALGMSLALAACAGKPTPRVEAAERVAWQAAFYQEEAAGWRGAGNAGMARYFEQRAARTRAQPDDADDNVFDFLFDIVFE